MPKKNRPLPDEEEFEGLPIESSKFKTMAWAASIILVPLIVTLMTQGVVLTNGYFKSETDNRQYDIKMVELALGILREDAEDTELAPVRGWAVDLLSQYSKVEIDEDAKTAMVENVFQVSPVDLSNSNANLSGSNIFSEKRAVDPDLIDELRNEAEASNTLQWMQFAIGELGVQEVPGSVDNIRILEYFSFIGHGWIKDDETPWQSAFVGWVLGSSGLEHTGKLNARSWLNWGKETTEPSFGAVAILWRQSRNAAYGEVGFVVGVETDHIKILAADIDGQVTVARKPKNMVLGFRMPH